VQYDYLHSGEKLIARIEIYRLQSKKRGGSAFCTATVFGYRKPPAKLVVPTRLLPMMSPAAAEGSPV
jgi:hypothetical protein